MKSYAMLCYAIYFSIQFTHANISNSSVKKLLENGYTTMEADPVQGSALSSTKIVLNYLNTIWIQLHALVAYWQFARQQR